MIVHGAWADGSSWNKVIPLLQAKNLQVIAVQIPLTGLEDDLTATTRIIADTEGPIVLVGHSWGGVAVTQAGTDPKVAALVYVSAFAPDIGESGSSLIAQHPAPPALSTIVTDSAGFVYSNSRRRSEQRRARHFHSRSADLGGNPAAACWKAFGQTVAQAAWKTKPTWFVVAPGDCVVKDELQQAEVKRMKAKTTVLQSSHMSLLSHPREVAAVIEDAAATVAAKP